MQVFDPGVDAGIGGERGKWRGLLTDSCAAVSRQSWRGGMSMEIGFRLEGWGGTLREERYFGKGLDRAEGTRAVRGGVRIWGR